MDFIDNVDAGLSAQQKSLSSRYFYDETGDKIFQEIMQMPEYYLTDCEHEIFSTRGSDILKAVNLNNGGFELVEFGAGDGYKTKILIDRLLAAGGDFHYMPIDISDTVLKGLQKDLKKQFPNLIVQPENAEYFKALEKINKNSKRPKLVLFLGSSIGNFMEDRTLLFLNSLYSKLNYGDKVLIGFDLQKDPATILRAYNDVKGITRAFNLNILTRINRELGGQFELDNFEHYPLYDPETGMAKSYLVSRKEHEVYVGALNKKFSFKRGEVIHTEISRKYTIDQIESLFTRTGFQVEAHFHDSKEYYVNTLAVKTRI